ncbi:T9SS type A sorting domain-containing protein [Mangrovimonas aestuarii]|uniref:T9SS type A sorting domain-containing protein n=1 Tax=Mangrovimonas aestuarii TaxID=3018443 RepID=UPI002378BCC8|nr:T9SS type A sorting domain-containing protein [Mangrovimonas aestuarii]
MKKVTFFLWAFLLSIVGGYAQMIGTQTFTASGLDSDSFTLTITPDQISVNQGQTMTAVTMDNVSMTYSAPGGTDYCGNWYDFGLTVTGGSADGTSIPNGCVSDFINMDITGFTTLTFTSNNLDTYNDQVFLSVDLEVTFNTPPCPAPINVAVTLDDVSQATISWEEGGTETDWSYEYGDMGFDQGLGTPGTVTSNPSVVIGALTPGASYDIYIQANCGGDDSVWIGPFTWTQKNYGETCELPITVTSLPYNVADDTSLYGDDYSGIPGSTGCGVSNNFLNGDDVVYAYTATADESIEVSLTPTNAYAGIFVYTDCADIGVACVGGDSYNWEEGTVELNFDLDVITGTTYYFVISTWAQPQSTGYVFELTQNTCIDATASFLVVPDCNEVNSGFLVEVDITDMGDANSLTIADDQGSTAEVVTEAGLFVFGPYDNATIVNIAVNDTDDPNCPIYSGALTQMDCPVPGQNCVSAIEIGSIPYFTTDDTSNYFDDYDANPGDSCGGNQWFLESDEVVYVYTPSVDTSIEVKLIPSTPFVSSGVFVYNSCTDIGVNCVAGMGGYQEFINFDMDVTAGTPYYFVIGSSWTQSIGYDFQLTENTCIDASANYFVVSDCDEGNSGFLIDVDITDMGDADSLTITDDQGSTAQVVSGIGIVTFGPFDNGTNVNITVNDTDDPNCPLFSGPLSQAACPIPGQICSEALEITSLPYSTTDNTSNYFDDYSQEPGESCGTTGYYLDGDDVVYVYTATADTSIEVSLLPTEIYAGVFVYESCADIGVSCIAGGSNGFGAAEINFDMDVVMGTSYYFVISTWASPQSTAYTFELTDNTCSNATATYTVVDNCDTTGEFFVDVDITDMGSASSLTIADDFFGFVETATATGVVQFGPYTSGTSVSFTVTDDNDASCEFTSDPVTFDCPPSNDDCSVADVVTQETGIIDVASATAIPGTIDGSTDSGLAAEGCDGGTGGTANDDVWYTFEALTSDVNITFDANFDCVVQLYSGTCEGGLSVMDCSDSNFSAGVEEVQATGLTVGETYYVRIYAYASAPVADGSFDLKLWSPTTLGVEELEQLYQFSYYPNPVSSNLVLTAQKNIQHVAVFNMLGQQVINAAPNTMKVDLDMSNLQTGAYFVKVSIDGNLETIRVIKQ